MKRQDNKGNNPRRSSTPRDRTSTSRSIDLIQDKSRDRTSTSQSIDLIQDKSRDRTSTSRSIDSSQDNTPSQTSSLDSSHDTIRSQNVIRASEPVLIRKINIANIASIQE